MRSTREGEVDNAANEAGSAATGATVDHPPDSSADTHGARLDHALSLDRQFRAEQQAELRMQLREAETQEKDGGRLCTSSLVTLGWAVAAGVISLTWLESPLAMLVVVVVIPAVIAILCALIMLPIGGMTIAAAKSRRAMLLLKARRLEIDVLPPEEAG